MTRDSASRLSGVFCPVITPFDKDLMPDAARLARQCRWLLSQNVGLAIFGTNSEANSLSVDEKVWLLDSIIAAGIDPRRMLPGTGCCALTDTVRLTKQVDRAGCAGVLVLPPFYYKDVSDDGLFRYFSEVIDRVGSETLRVYLYDIEPLTKVPLSLDLIERLIVAYPKTIAGIKDSTGRWSNTQALLERQWDGFRVFVGSETFLLANMEGGGAGCISATANINPAAIHSLYEQWQSGNAGQLQAKLDQVRNVILSFPVIPALKCTVAHYGNDPGWATVRPPLEALNPVQSESLINALTASGFDYLRLKK